MSADRINDGGPAFPLTHFEAVAFAQAAEDCANPKLDAAERTYCEARRNALGGMTLRDYFAARALQSVLDGSWPDLHLSPISGLTPVENSARFAYDIADAMLKARTA